MLSYIKKIIASSNKDKHSGDELEQAKLRLAVSAFIMLYLAFHIEVTNFSIFGFFAGFFLCSICLFYWIKSDTKQKPARITGSMLLDLTGTTYTMYIADDAGAIMIAFYLWLIIGYGLRYGRSYVVSSTLLSLLGFTIATSQSAYWQQHPTFVNGLLVSLIVVPIYAFVLIQKLKRATDIAEKNSRAKGEFLSHMSHEIRTPINGIIGACELMNVQGENKENLDIIKSSASHLTDLVSGVLDMAAIEQGTLQREKAPTDIRRQVTEAVNIFSSAAKRKGLQLKVNYPDEIPNGFITEKTSFKEIIVNLVNNALKFTETGGVVVNVSKAKQVADIYTLRIEVADTGIGISEENLEKIWDSFSQANDDIKFSYGGTGLGTTISKSLVEQLDGQMGVSSELGRGSTFWFELPMQQVEIEETAQAENLIPFKPVRNDVAYKVLIADDAEINRTLLNKILSKEGFEVTQVTDGEQALDYLESNPCDLAILDNNMPGTSGIEAMQLYNVMKAGTKAVPIFIFSADATAAAQEKALEAGAAGYFTKPIQSDQLIQAIYEVLDGQVERQEAKVIDFTTGQEQEDSLLDTDRLGTLIELFGGTEQVFSMIDSYSVDAVKHIENLEKAFKSSNFKEVSMVAHTLAGISGDLAAQEMMSLCKEIEKESWSTSQSKKFYQFHTELKAKLTETLSAFTAHIARQEQSSVN